jgi:hypothetical protein
MLGDWIAETFNLCTEKNVASTSTFAFFRTRSVQTYSGSSACSRRVSIVTVVAIALAIWTSASIAASDPISAKAKPTTGSELSFCAAAAALLLPGAASLTAEAVGVTAVLHSSGAWILTGAAGYVANTLAGATATALGILTTPAALAVVGTAATIGVAGGAYCLATGKNAKN